MLYSWHFSKICRTMKMWSMVDLFESLLVYFLLFQTVGYLAKLHIFYRLCLIVLLACSYYSSACHLFYKLGKWFLHSIGLGEFLNSKCCRLVSLQVVGKINCWGLKVFISWKNFLVSFLLWLYSICNILLFIHALFST